MTATMPKKLSKETAEFQAVSASPPMTATMPKKLSIPRKAHATHRKSEVPHRPKPTSAPTKKSEGFQAERQAGWRRPVAADSVAVFRIGFGLLVAFSSLRFLWKGWVDTLYLAPENHLTYRWFGWVAPLPAPWMHLVVLSLAVLGICIALGYRHRLATALFIVGFGYTELIEASLYLNHYWFITLAAMLLLLLPAHRHWSLDAMSGRYGWTSSTGVSRSDWIRQHRQKETEEQPERATSSCDGVSILWRDRQKENEEQTKQATASPSEPTAGLLSKKQERAGRVASSTHVEAWVVWALRAQVGIVYLFAGLAKLNGDWLFHAQPLRLWLADRTHLPVIGPFLDEPLVAYAASWSSAAFDCTIVAWLLCHRSRPWAYAVLVVFHTATWLLFPKIGVFPWVMIFCTLVFFPPDWPRKLAGRAKTRLNRLRYANRQFGKSTWELPRSSRDTEPSDASNTAWELTPNGTTTGEPEPIESDIANGKIFSKTAQKQISGATTGIENTTNGKTTSLSRPVILRSTARSGSVSITSKPASVSRPVIVLLAIFAAAQIFLPLRHYLEPGNVRWNEQGYYLSWRVMLTEKAGALEYEVADSATGRSWLAYPELVLTDWQAAHASTRPDLIHATALLIANHYQQQGIPNAEVRANSWVSMNAREAKQFIDPTINLAAHPRGKIPHGWILNA